MTREEIVAAMRQLGHLNTVAHGFAAGHLDAEYVLAHISIDCWAHRSDEWRAAALPVLSALRDLAPEGALR